MNPIIRLSFYCEDCNYDTYSNNEYYMVKHSIWHIYGCGIGMLCIGCLENRMGRLLTYRDFLNCPLNAKIERKSDRLLDRLDGFKYERRL